LQEPNLGKTNHCVIRSISLVDLFSASLSDSTIFLTLTRLVVVLKVYKFQICLFTPPLGDFQKAFETGGEFQILRMLLEIIYFIPLAICKRI
jgi:hypothetical protein